MRILITGGAGFVGKHLVNRLIELGDDVVVVDNLISGTKFGLNKKAKFVEMDVNKLITGNRFRGHFFDTIYHLAAQPRIQPSFHDNGYTLQNNLTTTIQVLEYAKIIGANVIYAGSSSCHGGIMNSPYAFSKYTGGQICELYSKLFNVPTTIVRFYNAYGPGQIEFGKYATVIGVFEKAYRENRPLPITGTGDQRRDFTYIDDITDALVLLKNKKYYGKIFELGRGENFSINEIVEMFKSKKIHLNQRSGEYPQTLANYEEAYKELGWEPFRNLEDYVKNILQNKQ